MEEVLFQKSFHAVWQNGLRLATEDVQKLDRKLFNDPTLGGALQRIVQKYDIDVASFEGEMTAKRRTEEREGRDSWGDHRKIKTTWLDVSIPFVGEAETLRIGPSSMALLNHRATIGRHTLTLSVPDDERAESVVQDFKKMVEGNLQALRAEYERNKPQLEQAIQQAATQRKAQIDAEDARDKGRSFRIMN
jgi:ribosomal protein S21